MENTQYTGLQRALMAVGDVPRLARALGVTQKVINNWLREDGVTPPPETRPEDSAIRRAVKQAGGSTKMGLALGVSHQAVEGWIRQGYVPKARAQEIELQFGVPRVELISPKVRNELGLGGGDL